MSQKKLNDGRTSPQKLLTVKFMIANNKSKIRLSWCNLNLNSTSILDGDENAEAKK